METPPRPTFKPQRGPGGRGRQRIWVNKSTASHLVIKNILRPLVSAATAPGNKNAQETKLVPLIQHPFNPTDRDGFVLAFEVGSFTMRSQDVDQQLDSNSGGRVRFNFEIPDEIAKIHDDIDEISLRFICSAKPGSYTEYPKKGDAVSGVSKPVDNFVKWWTQNESIFRDLVRQAREDVDLKHTNFPDWTDEDHGRFSDAMYKRLAVMGRDPDFEKPPDGAGLEEIKKYNAAKRPVAPQTAYKREADGKRVIGASALNFKKGEVETTTRNGKEIPREQTLFALFDPETGITTPIEDTAKALKMLMHSSKGVPGYPERPFTIHVEKAVYSIRHRWFNAKGANSSCDFEVVKFYTTDEDDDPYAEAIGLSHRAAHPKAEESGSVREVEEEAPPAAAEEVEPEAEAEPEPEAEPPAKKAKVSSKKKKAEVEADDEADDE